MHNNPEVSIHSTVPITVRQHMLFEVGLSCVPLMPSPLPFLLSEEQAAAQGCHSPKPLWAHHTASGPPVILNASVHCTLCWNLSPNPRIHPSMSKSLQDDIENCSFSFELFLLSLEPWLGTGTILNSFPPAISCFSIYLNLPQILLPNTHSNDHRFLGLPPDEFDRHCGRWLWDPVWNFKFCF